MSKQARLDEAARRFSDFTGIEGVDVNAVNVPPVDDVMVSPL